MVEKYYLLTRLDMLIIHSYWPSKLKPDHYQFKAYTKNLGQGIYAKNVLLCEVITYYVFKQFYSIKCIVGFMWHATKLNLPSAHGDRYNAGLTTIVANNTHIS